MAIRLPKRIKNRTTGKPASAGQVARHRAMQSRKYRAVAGAIFCIGRCGRHSARRETRNFLRAITGCRPSSLISENFGVANAIATQISECNSFCPAEYLSLNAQKFSR